jgi:hypothetical protein
MTKLQQYKELKERSVKSERRNFMTRIVSTRIFAHFLTALNIGMVVFIFVIAYWLFAPYKVIDWRVDHLEMTQKTYKVGEKLSFHTSFCKHYDFENQNFFTIVDGVSYPIPFPDTKRAKGCYDFINTSLEVPNLPSGLYHLDLVIVYKVNPFREVSYKIDSTEFKIIGKE